MYTPLHTASNVLIVVHTPLPQWNVEKGLSRSGTMLTSLEQRDAVCVQTEGAEVRFLKRELIGVFIIELTNFSTAYLLCARVLVMICRFQYVTNKHWSDLMAVKKTDMHITITVDILMSSGPLV